MRYKIVITFPELSTAEKVFELLSKSRVYNSKEIMCLNKIKEVCDECCKRENQ